MINMINIIEYQGKHYVFRNTWNEPEHAFVKRTWFYVKNAEKYSGNLKYLESLSHLWINIQVHGVTYSEAIMKELKECNSIYDEIC